MSTQKFHVRVDSVQQYYGHPTHNIDVTIEIDFFRLAAKIGSKAFFNTKKRSRLLGGVIVVKAKEI